MKDGPRLSPGPVLAHEITRMLTIGNNNNYYFSIIV